MSEMKPSGVFFAKSSIPAIHQVGFAVRTIYAFGGSQIRRLVLVFT